MYRNPLEMKVLVLGHGWKMWRARDSPRCAPIGIDAWNKLVQDNIPDNITFLDLMEDQEPDIFEDVGNEWSVTTEDIGTYDYVIDSITHIAIQQRRSVNYWNGILCALNEGGTYIGWDNTNTIPISNRRLHLKKQELADYMKQVELYTPKKKFKLYHSNQ